MKNIRYSIATLLVIVLSHAAVAQTALSSYFLDGMLYNSKINPAMQAERSYFSLLLGNTSVGLKGNVGLSNFLYPRGENELATFMSGSVTADEFLSGIPEKTKLGMNLDETIMAFGFPMLGGYFTFDLSAHSSVGVSLPKGLFEFAKKGLQENRYSFSGLNINATSYAAASIGYSREIFDGFQIGANAKYLLGLAHADIFVDKLDVELSGQRWMVESRAQAQAALFCGTDVEIDENNIIKSLELALGQEDLMNLRASGGFAVDLGVVYDMKKLVPGLTLSASVVDLGYINWRYMLSGQSTDAKVEFDGFGEVDVKTDEFCAFTVAVGVRDGSKESVADDELLCFDNLVPRFVGCFCIGINSISLYKEFACKTVGFCNGLVVAVNHCDHSFVDFADESSIALLCSDTVLFFCKNNAGKNLIILEGVNTVHIVTCHNRVDNSDIGISLNETVKSIELRTNREKFFAKIEAVVFVGLLTSSKCSDATEHHNECECERNNLFHGWGLL